MKILTTMTVLFLFSLGAPVPAQVAPPENTTEQELMESALAGNLDNVRRLVSEGANVDSVDAEKRTALMFAAFNGHTQVVEYLLQIGAKLEHKDSTGRTALLYASSGPYPETVELLLKKKAKVNIQGTLEGFTALMTAAAEGQIEVVRLLLEYGADPDIVDTDNDTAASFARLNGHTAVEALLKDPPPATPGTN